MERRELLKLIAVLTGGAMIGGDVLLTGCKTGSSTTAFSLSDAQVALLDEVGETILPKTNTPGAKETGIGNFMRSIITDCYEAKDQQIFTAGFKKLDEACEKMHKTSFMKATAAQRTSLLTALDKEAKEYNKTKKKEDPEHYFTMYKQLTLWGFFSSEKGSKEVLRYEAVPGKFDGNLPYKKGDRAWAT